MPNIKPSAKESQDGERNYFRGECRTDYHTNQRSQVENIRHSSSNPLRNS